MTVQDFETMMFNESSQTATLLTARGVTDLDAMLGEGYAAVLAQWIAVAGSQFLHMQQMHAANGLAHQIERLAGIADAIEASAAAAHAGRMQ
jgi:hypothetical protein